MPGSSCLSRVAREGRRRLVRSAAKPVGVGVVSTRPFVVAIAGRPNAGKSTLFNRLLGRRHAIVHETAGVTRDENRAFFEREGHDYEMVDTGGIEQGGVD
ncbi:MAG: GTP-binding protein, partial [bacterium]|nr:GTP-binding protein [bacterium]